MYECCEARVDRQLQDFLTQQIGEHFGPKFGGEIEGPVKGA
jgi:hypothetical protein